MKKKYIVVHSHIATDIIGFRGIVVGQFFGVGSNRSPSKTGPLGGRGAGVHNSGSKVARTISLSGRVQFQPEIGSVPFQGSAGSTAKAAGNVVIISLGKFRKFPPRSAITLYGTITALWDGVSSGAGASAD